MRWLLLAFLALSSSLCVRAVSFYDIPHPKVEDRLTRRLFPELVRFWEQINGSWPEHVQSDIKSLAEDRKKRIANTFNCTEQPICHVKAMNLTVSDEYRLNRVLNASHAPKSLLDVWPRYVQAIRHIISVYGNGTASYYSADDMVYNATGSDWTYYIRGLSDYLASDFSGTIPPPFDVIYGAVTLLQVNLMDNAAWFYDVNEQQNKAARERASSIDWDKYPYAAILNLGMGPEVRIEPLSPQSKMRLGISVTELHKGQAPWIVVTGGAVHPPKTPFTEAQEMQLWLKEQYDLDEKYILMEPHARHTTTNLRNSARMVNKLGAPKDKPFLIVSNSDQYEYILQIGADHYKYEDSLLYAGERDLGYKLGEVKAKNKEFLIEYRPNWDKIFIIDPMDPLDP
ncbi:hypothetical protein MNAN1_001452 [Malassezia nana]|uniref:DUF218 domain-containing protein n=1 Tax=Malassezia nana TaxID=180528 RepID=A0AAF0J215_9BASI|nr:hypothetical protein MNAN1_001452 [Malassezia nana]